MARATLDVRFCFLLLAIFFTSCSLDPERYAPRSSEGSPTSTIKPVSSADGSDLSRTVKMDEFNDQATGTEIPTKGGQVVVQFLAEPDKLNSYLDNSAVANYITEYIYSSLIKKNKETFEWQPDLAERWLEEDVVVKKDGSKLRGKAAFTEPGDVGDVTLRTASAETLRVPRAEIKDVHRDSSFTFFLRKNAKFHDGHPVTASDVKFTYDAIRNPEVDDASIRSYFEDLESCEVLDAHTVRMTYSKQYWAAKDYAGGDSFQVLPRHIFDPDGLIEKDPKAFAKEFNENQYNRKPVGSGPYRFVKWETGSQVTMERNDDYFDERRKGHLDRIVIKFMSDTVAALQALKNGEVNFVTRIKPEQFQQETRDRELLKRFAKVEIYSPNFSYVGWNMRHPPFDDPKVRMAMAYGALDVQEYIDKIMYGRGVRVAAYQYFYGPAYDHTLQPIPYDPEKAKQLLLEAGWYDRDGDGIRDKDGKPFRFELLQASGGTSRVAPFMKEKLRKLGIDMTIRELEWATFLENVYDRRFDACTLAWGLDLEGDPYQLWHTSQKENRGSNHVGFGNPETDRMIELSRTLVNDAERREAFHRFDRILFEQQPYLFLYMAPDLGLYDKRYRGVKWYKLRPGYDLTEWFLPQGAS